jgi:hypothetical protein
MSYKIAIASSDEITIDLKFGSATAFLIYEVRDDGTCECLERRIVSERVKTEVPSMCGEKGECLGGGCHSSGPANPRVDLIADCRCVLCKKTGDPIQKQLDKKAISSFDVTGEIEDALHKIAQYFYRVDHHHSLRGIASGSMI